MDLIKIGKYIAGKRKSLGMTQKQLAEKLGMSDKLSLIHILRSRGSRSVINIASTAISAFWALLMLGIVALAMFLTFVQ